MSEKDRGDNRDRGRARRDGRPRDGTRSRPPRRRAAEGLVGPAALRDGHPCRRSDGVSPDTAGRTLRPHGVARTHCHPVPASAARRVRVVTRGPPRPPSIHAHWRNKGWWGY